MSQSIITCQQVADTLRIKHTAGLFGIHFPLNIEPAIYSVARNIASEYIGGFWEFYALSNGGFYMAPSTATKFNVVCENGYDGALSADALGIVACMYAYSHLSFCDQEALTEKCVNHYHLLRDYMLSHTEASMIIGAID